jgi:hypothetical protein
MSNLTNFLLACSLTHQLPFGAQNVCRYLYNILAYGSIEVPWTPSLEFGGKTQSKELLPFFNKKVYSLDQQKAPKYPL